MNRNSIIIILIVLILLLAGGGYFYIKQQQTQAKSGLEAVPIDAAVILQINKATTFIPKIKNNLVFDNTQLLKQCKILGRWVEVADSMMAMHPELNEILSDKPIFISLHQDASTDFYPLISCAFNSKQQGRKIVDFLRVDLSKSGTVNKQEYNHTSIYQFIVKGDKTPSWYFSFYRGYLLISANEMLLQSALRQTESKFGVEKNATFVKIQQSAGKHVDGTVFIQFKYFVPLIKKLTEPNLFTNLAVDAFAEWGGLDINLKSNTWLFNGFSMAESKRYQWSKIFENQQPQPITLVQHIPTSVEGFTVFGISNLDAYFKALAQYMDQIGQPGRYQTNVSQVQNSFGNDFYNRLSAIFTEGLAQLAMNDGSSIFLFKTKGAIEAGDFVKYMVSSSDKPTLPQEYKIDNETAFNIFELPLQNLPVRVFGPWFSSCTAKYICNLNDLVIMGDSYQALSRFLYDNVLEKTMQFDPEYGSFSNYLGNNANFYLYLSFVGTGGLLSHLVNQQAFNQYNQDLPVWQNHYGIAWQFSANATMLYHNILFRYQPTNIAQSATQWETHLDTLIAFKPALVENHLTGEKEIFVQDMKNTIYLINNAGRILWKKNLEEPIIGDVQQIDYYRNRKLQYIFNTASSIYLLDRNGNAVEHYPVKLPARTSQPIAVFDYEKNKNYRLFAVLNDKRVIAYTIDGKTIPQFGFSKTNSEPVAPVQHFIDKTLDYIVISDVNRTYILDRQGKTRFELSENFEPSVNNQFAYLPVIEKQPSALVRTSVDGTVYFVMFDGKIQKLKAGNFSPNHFFSLQDVCSDKYPEMVFVDSNKVSVFALNGKLIYDHSFNSVITQQPSFYRFSANEQVIGITESASSRIFLVDSRGQIMKGFPLKGKTRFSIGYLRPGQEKFSLIVGGDEQYLYNYNLN